jgi:outer membrane protein assembly factor BamD
MAIAFSSPNAFAKKHDKKKKEVDLTANPLVNVNSKQPDKELFDKAYNAMKHGKYDVARLDLQTLLNTYPDSEFAMRSKLLVGDTWFKEGGSAALTQAESEYKDFITFFPNTPEADEGRRHLFPADGKAGPRSAECRPCRAGIPRHAGAVPRLAAHPAR